MPTYLPNIWICAPLFLSERCCAVRNPRDESERLPLLEMTGYALDFGVPATALSLYATATSGILSGAIVLFLLPFLK